QASASSAYARKPTEYAPTPEDEEYNIGQDDSDARRESNPDMSRQLSRVLTNAKSIDESVRRQEEMGIPIPPMGN
ncbi:hypothetical protein WICPIJ_006293, partial [Wickerhamomyces pijperi]